MAPKRTREDPDANAAKSLLSSAAEIAFPRGGASVLTPMEIKEVSNEAKRDVLFEQSKNSELNTEEGNLKKRAKRSKKSKTFNLLSKDEQKENDKHISIDFMSFNILNPGSFVLGIVKQINKMELILSLPDNLVGYIPITNISKEQVKLLEQYDDQEESSEEEVDSDDEDNDDGKSILPKQETPFPQLEDRFVVGQYLRAKVVKNSNEKQKKRIELSLEPENANSPMEEKEDLVENAIVQAAVVSVEDHGAILRFNNNFKTTGFISTKEITGAGLKVQPGSVILVSIAKLNSRTATCKIPSSALKKQPMVSALSSIDALLPGMLVDAVIKDVQKDGLVCKVHDLCDGTITLQHMNSHLSPEEIKHNYAIGSTLKARVIATYMKNATTKLALSVLPHHQTLTFTGKDALEAFPIGHVFDKTIIKGKSSKFLFVDLLSGNISGQVHNSKIGQKDDIDLFKIGTTHQARVLDYTLFDNFYILTMDKAQIEIPFVRANDIPIGTKVSGKIEKVSADGIVLNIDSRFQATVPPNHISDIKLVYPERKFKIGSLAKARILNVRSSGSKAHLTATLKRSLVNAEDEDIIANYNDLEAGKRIPATVEKILPSGCVVSFFGSVSAFLPISEISETYVQNANDYVKVGQTVKVRVISVDKENQKCLVSLRISGDLSETQSNAISQFEPGKTIVKVEILEKQRDAVNVKLAEFDVNATIPVAHLADGPIDIARGQLKKLKVGELIDALVLSVDQRKRGLVLTSKPSLIADSQNGTLPTEYSDISISDKILHGFVKTVIPTGVFVSFANNLTGLVIPRFAAAKKVHDLTTLYTTGQSVSCSVVNVDENNNRFLLSLLVETANSKEAAINPVDKSVKKLGDFSVGKTIKCSIKSVEPTCLIVKLADNQDGKIDISEIYDDITDIKDLKNPLAVFNTGKKLDAKIIGYYDLEKNKFSYSKKSKTNLVELTMKPSNLKDNNVVYPISFNDLKVGDNVSGYISSVNNGYFWYNISPAQKAKLSFVDITDDVSKLENFEEEFKVGTVVPTKISNIDIDHYAVNVSGKSKTINSASDIKVGDILPSLILNVRDNSVLVSLGDNITAVSMVTDALDDYTLNLHDVFHVGEFHTATVVSTERKIYVSLRSKNAKDRLINSIEDLKRGDIVRGYINKITNAGLFVDLGRSVYALVRVSDISDSFINDWKSRFEVHQSVKGRIIEAGSEGRILMSLKDSVVNGKLSNLKTFADLSVGEIFEGTIKKVEEYGVFVTLDGTDGISGLCHRSQITDTPIKNAEDIFNVGERVKVKILELNPEKKQMSLGMKASYFKDDNSDQDEDGDVEMKEEDAAVESEDENMDIDDADNKNEEENDESDGESEEETKPASTGLSAGLSTGFDWTASILEQAKEDESSDEEEEFDNEVNKKSKKKPTKSIDVEDKTGDLDTRAPQSISDFERLLVGNPDSSILWIQYMSFQLQLSEIEKAREIGERALKTINFREEQQKMNIWIALLNLENTFGDDETLEALFKRSCQYMDAFTMHQKLVAIYIASEKFDKADSLFKVMCKKFGSKNPSAWVSYGSFLLDKQDNEEAHKVLAKALQILPKRDHVDVVRKFAQLEFQKGDPEQGRSLFEGLLSDVPKRIDLWNVYIDQEIKINEKARVDNLFERVVEKKLSRKQAKFFFGKWLGFEETHGDEKSQDYVKAKAAEYAEKLSK